MIGCEPDWDVCVRGVGGLLVSFFPICVGVSEWVFDFAYLTDSFLPRGFVTSNIRSSCSVFICLLVTVGAHFLAQFSSVAWTVSPPFLRIVLRDFIPGPFFVRSFGDSVILPFGKCMLRMLTLVIPFSVFLYWSNSPFVGNRCPAASVSFSEYPSWFIDSTFSYSLLIPCWCAMVLPLVPCLSLLVPFVMPSGCWGGSVLLFFRSCLSEDLPCCTP